MKPRRRVDHTDLALALFSNICGSFGLRFERIADAPVEVMVIVPVQEGLSFPTTFMLQNVDELWLEAGGFTLSLFPCSRERVVGKFRTAAMRLFSGEARIVQRYIGRLGLSGADLEVKDGDTWRRVYRYRRVGPLLTLAALMVTPRVEVLTNEGATASRKGR